MAELGKLMVTAGIAFVAVGLALIALGRLGGGGWLPGDIVVQRKNFTFVFPLVTCLVVSIVLTVVFNLFLRR